MTVSKLDVDQPIRGLIINDTQSTVQQSVFVDDGITSIKPYRENDGALWFTVWMDDAIIKRINGRFVIEVLYFAKGVS